MSSAKGSEIIHGNCLDVLRQMPDASVDAIVADPPYSSGGASAAARQLDPAKKYMQKGQTKQWASFGGDTRDARSFLAWAVLWLTECYRVAKIGAPICVFTDWRQLPATTDAVQCADFTWRGIAVWDKTNGARRQMGRFSAQAEYVVWGSKGPLPQHQDVGCLPGVFRVANPKKDKHHMTGKPTEVMRQIARICPAGGVILDPLAGSGSTGVGALLEGRRFIGIEREAHYHAVAQSRLADARDLAGAGAAL